MYHVLLAVQYVYGCSDEGGENGDGKKGRGWRLPGLLYADDLVLWCELEENLRVMLRYFIEVCRRGLKVNPGNSRVKPFGGSSICGYN